jgi:hypothetical protein
MRLKGRGRGEGVEAVEAVLSFQKHPFLSPYLSLKVVEKRGFLDL